MTPPTLSPVARRWLKRGALAWGGWLLLGALLLNQPLTDDWINRKPVKFHVQWDFALSLLPGHVMAWGVDLRGQSRGLAFGVHARRGSAWWVPWALANKTIKLTGVRASGLAVAVRKGAVTLPPPVARQKPWTLLLSDVSFTDLWSARLGTVAELSGHGHGHVQLRKVLSGGELEIRRGQLAWEDVRATLAGTALVQGGRFDAQLKFAPLATSGSTLTEKVHALSLDLALDVLLLPVALDSRGMHRSDQPDERGRLTAKLALVEGALDRASQLELKQPVHVQFEGVRDDRDLSLRLAVSDGNVVVDANLPRGKGPTSTVAAQLRLPLSSLEPLRTSAGRKAIPSLPRYLLGKSSGSVDLSLRFRSLALIRPWLAKWRGLEASGDGWMHADLEFDQGRIGDGSTLGFEDVALSVSAMEHRIEARVDGPLAPVDAASGRRRLELQQVKLFGPGDLLLLQDAGAKLDVVPNPGQQGLLHFPGLALAIKDAQIPDIAVLNAYLPPGAVVLGKGAAKLGLDVALDAQDASANGQLELHAPAVQVSLGDMRLQGSLGVNAALRDADFERKTLDLGGSRLTLRDVRFDGPEGRMVSGWAMDATVDSAQAVVAAPLKVQGTGRVAMSDLRLLLSVYSQISDYPLWILRLADAGQVTANGRFAMGDGKFRLTGLHAQNERFAVDAGLQLDKQEKRGALLASWGPLAVAVELGKGESKMHVVQARDWYRRQNP